MFMEDAHSLRLNRHLKLRVDPTLLSPGQSSFKHQGIIDRVLEMLFRPQVAFRRQNRLMPQRKLNLLEFPTLRAAELCCRAPLCHLAGGELEQIQFLLGHASVQTTARYLGCRQKLGHAVNNNLGLENP
jgi:integrase